MNIHLIGHRPVTFCAISNMLAKLNSKLKTSFLVQAHYLFNQLFVSYSLDIRQLFISYSLDIRQFFINIVVFNMIIDFCWTSESSSSMLLSISF